MFAQLRNRLQRQVSMARAPLERLAERQIILQARALAHSLRQSGSLKGLHAIEFCAFSQWGEDGILDWLAERLPGIPRTFIEFGVGDYTESNTRLLLQLRNWRGLILDGSAAHIASIRSQELYWRHDLQATQAFIDRENINALLSGGGMQGEIGLLSVDIDGNDYWVWEAIDTVSPAIVVAEYNAVLGDLHQITVPYRPDFQRAKAHHSHLYFGASLPALIALGERKGYQFIGTAAAGCNAFFIRRDLAAPVLAELDEIWAFPTVAREARDEHGQLLFASGAQRLALISRLPVVDLASQRQVPLQELGTLVSPQWQSGQGVRI